MMIEEFIKIIQKEIILISNDELNIDNMDLNCLKYIKLKGLEFFENYFNLLKENKLNLKYFVKVELEEYYKKYNKKDYSIYLSFQKYFLDKLEKYEKQEIINKNFRELKQDEYILRKWTDEDHPHDFQMFMELRQRGRRIASSLPGYSTHGETKWLSPLTEWRQEL